MLSRLIIAFSKVDLLLIIPNNKGSSFIAQLVKNLPERQETQVQSLSPEDPLDKNANWGYSIKINAQIP